MRFARHAASAGQTATVEVYTMNITTKKTQAAKRSSSAPDTSASQ